MKKTALVKRQLLFREVSQQEREWFVWNDGWKKEEEPAANLKGDTGRELDSNGPKINAGRGGGSVWR